MNETYRVIAMDSAEAAALRATRRDDEGNPVEVRRDGQPHQCRHCLRLSAPDEAVLLSSYRPFPGAQPYAERGPVFVHERACVQHDGGGYPAEFPRRAVVLRAYDAAHAMIAAEVVGERPVEGVIGDLLRDPRVAYLHARNAAEGCYMFRIERAGAAPAAASLR
jgi:hypothetical protein